MSIPEPSLSDAQDDIREIEALLTRLSDSVCLGDVDAIASVFCDDAVSIFTGTTGRVRGVADIADVWRKHINAWSDVHLARDDTLVRIHGDTAWATFTWTGSGSAEGAIYEMKGERWSVVLLWEDGAWRFAQTHSSLPFTDWALLKADA